MKRFGWPAGVAVCLAVGAGPALAKVTVCNKYTTTIYAAIGTVINGDTQTQGWWQVAPGQCSIVDPGPLASPFYIMARTDADANGNLHAWGTGTHLAISMDQFHYFNAQKIGKDDNTMEFDELTKGDDKDQQSVTWTVEDANTVGLDYSDDQ